MSEVISSFKNSKIKFLRSLYRKKYRRRNNKFILEGSRIITDALEAKADIDQIFYSAQFLSQQKNKELLAQLREVTEIIEITDSLLNKIADTATPQGIIAIVNQPEFELEDFLIEDNDLFLIIDRIQDPGNLGTILRTADGAGVDGVFLLKGTVDIYNLKTIRATMGSLFRVPVFGLNSPSDLTDILQMKDIQMVAADIEAKDYYYELDYNQPTALVIGNEGAGAQPETLKLADKKVKIPLSEGIDSLNAAIASGIIMYEMVRQRKNNP
ncbi:TrmH family RNA methyltransferase [Acetohalobium arabaticum]|uniref:tRNA/rRNA methyltransferase (SpoU) n=1 Tax=Acetohalobium arabaticum (strain ATCC 49924 / DSM 5501 / Z-7288) TaxID=574087 RepID=D9QUE9_ACEAZ|nr:RNA methyltransferase [Acetohalobium arabaticum]ADL11942.1 tRNA/rRNA methyltransferase (SpoU) [Acetohalobium arabaticum DSM 5501]